MTKEELVQRLKSLYDLIELSLGELKFDGENNKHQMLMPLLGTICECYMGCVVLLNSEIVSQIPILCRNMLEALIDAEHIVENEHGLKDLLAEYHWHKIELARILLKYELFPDDETSIKAQRDKHKKTFYSLAHDGYFKREWSEKISNSSLPQEFKIACVMCSAAAHNNLSALDESQITAIDSQLSFMAFNGLDILAFEQYAQLMCAAMINAVIFVYKCLDTPASTHFEKAVDSYHELMRTFSQLERTGKKSWVSALDCLL